MDSSVVSVGAGLLGALIGGGVTLLGGALQRRWQVRSDRHNKRAANAELAARTCDELVRTIRSATETRVRTPREERRSIEAEFDRQVSLAQHELDAQVLLLPIEFRDRLTLLVDILRTSHWMTVDTPLGGTHYHREPSIIYAVCEDARSVLAAYLRGDRVPPRPHIIAEYVAAMADARAEMDEIYAEQLDDDRERAARVEFFQRHPDLADGDDKPSE